MPRPSSKLIAQALEEIRLSDRYKLLKPKAVVDAASSEESPLHSLFEWDDSAAAQLHRENQARKIIVGYRVVIPHLSPKPIQGFVSLSSDRERGNGGYRPIIDVFNSTMLRATYLQDAIREVEEVQKKYDRVTQLAKVWEEFKKVKRKHGKDAGGTEDRKSPDRRPSNSRPGSKVS